jgi:hypothetical protein
MGESALYFADVLDYTASAGYLQPGVWGYLFFAITAWPVFVKAGFPGWGALIPLWNIYVLTKIAGYSGWTLLLLLIPVVNLIWGLLIAVGIAQAFGRGFTFAVFLLWFVPPIGYAIIGWGSSVYFGPGGRVLEPAQFA